VAIQQHIQTVATVKPFDLIISIPHQSHLHLIGAGPGKMPVDHEATASSRRCTVGTHAILRQVSGDAERLATRTDFGTAKGQATDFFSSRNVSVEQCWAEPRDRDVVKAVTGFVCGQQGDGVNFKGKQIADGVTVFRSGQAAERFGTTGERLLGSEVIEGCSQ